MKSLILLLALALSALPSAAEAKHKHHHHHHVNHSRAGSSPAMHPVGTPRGAEGSGKVVSKTTRVGALPTAHYSDPAFETWMVLLVKRTECECGEGWQ